MLKCFFCLFLNVDVDPDMLNKLSNGDKMNSIGLATQQNSHD